MTLGEHLEELRKRLFLGAGGFILVFFIFMVPSIGESVVYYACRPLFIAQIRNGLNPQVHTTEAAEAFMTYIKAAMISAATIAGPWMIYQAWLFVSSGLYPSERKYVTKFLPLSIFLFITGVVFLYFYVLPLMLEFFIGFQIGDIMRLPFDKLTPSPATQPFVVPVLPSDPTAAITGQLWIDANTGLLKVCTAPGATRILPYGSGRAVNPIITLATYFEMVIGLLLSFGLAFQMPLVVMALARIGIVEIDTFRRLRRIVYFVLTILAAVIVPDVVTGMIALLVPLVLLYEMGILLAVWGKKKRDAEAAAAEKSK